MSKRNKKESSKLSRTTKRTAATRLKLDDLFSPTGRRMVYLYCHLSNIQKELNLAAEAGNFDENRAEALTDVLCGITEMIDFHIIPAAIPLTRGLPPESGFARADVPREDVDAEEAPEQGASAE